MENKFIKHNELTIPILTNQNDKAPPINSIKQKIKSEDFVKTNGNQPTLSSEGLLVLEEVINDSISTSYIINNNIITSIMELIDNTKNHKESLGRDYTLRYKTWRDYYSNGQLKSFSVKQNSLGCTDLKIGTWYYFDEHGNVLQTIEHEKHYKSSFFDILKIALSYNRVSFSINRSFNDQIAYWYINLYSKEGQNLPQISIVIDDNTGKIIEEAEIKDQADRKRLSKYFDEEYFKDLYKLFNAK